MKKSILKIQHDYSFRLIGLVTPEKDYRIGWFINEYGKIDLSRKDDIVIDKKEQSKKLFFCRFQYFSEEDKVEYILLCNKCNGDHLIPEWKEIDYFLKISGDFLEQQLDELVESLSIIPGVQLVKEVKADSLKSIDNLIFD